MADTTNEEFTGSNHLHSEKLRAFLERIMRIRADKKDLADDEAAVFAEAKSEGFAPKYMRAVLKLMEVKPSERAENEAMMEIYQQAVGMHRDLPLFRQIESMGVDSAARESVIDALKQLAPTEGEFTVKIGDGPRVRIWRTKDGVHTEEVSDMMPVTPKAERGDTPAAAARRADVPDVTPAEALEMGRQARRDDEPIMSNPFPWDDKRRRKWDEGWREEDGGDGMGPR